MVALAQMEVGTQNCESPLLKGVLNVALIPNFSYFCVFHTYKFHYLSEQFPCLAIDDITSHNGFSSAYTLMFGMLK